MPIPLQKKVLQPNIVYCPQLILQSGLVNGQLKTSAVITLAAANADAEGKLTSTGQNEMIHVPDVLALEPDLAELQPAIVAVFGQIVELLGRMNAIRKAL